MRTLGGIFFALLLATGLGAQRMASVTPTVTGSFGSVVFPGGTAATTPGATRSFGNLVNPGGGGPHLVIPGVVPGAVVPNLARPSNARPVRRTTTFYYPVYVGAGDVGYGYNDNYGPNSYSAGSYGADQTGAQQPNVTVVMPPQHATPVIINVGPQGQSSVYQPERQTNDQPAADQAAGEEPAHYLIAFKDHTIYSAVAYWVDGDTLHYFTAGNTHNQASLSLLDRTLTERLNKESGFVFKLPPAK